MSERGKKSGGVFGGVGGRKDGGPENISGGTWRGRPVVIAAGLGQSCLSGQGLILQFF